MSSRMQTRVRDADSSDMDMEDASLLNDMQELALVAEHQTRSSPSEPRATSVLKLQPPSAPHTIASRLSSHSSLRERQERITIFRDGMDAGNSANLVKAKLSNKIERNKSLPDSTVIGRAHNRSKSDTATKNHTPRESLSQPPAVQSSRLNDSSRSREQGQTRTHLVLTQKLQDLALERNSLLQRLTAINQKEQQIIGKIVAFSTASDNPLGNHHSDKLFTKHVPYERYFADADITTSAQWREDMVQQENLPQLRTVQVPTTFGLAADCEVVQDKLETQEEAGSRIGKDKNNQRSSPPSTSHCDTFAAENNWRSSVAIPVLAEPATPYTRPSAHIASYTTSTDYSVSHTVEKKKWDF